MDKIIVTLRELKARRACEDARAAFSNIFGESAEVTKESVLKAAANDDLSLGWFVYTYMRDYIDEVNPLVKKEYITFMTIPIGDPIEIKCWRALQTAYAKAIIKVLNLDGGDDANSLHQV